MSKNYNEMLPVFEQEKCIPRLLHQTYKSKIIEDADLKSNIEHLKTLNPLWRYTLYDDADIEEFILRYYGKEIYAYYQRIEPCYGAAKADFFRYLLMYKCGGVYLDIKSTNDLPLDDVLLPDEQYILAHWDNLEGGMYVDHGRHPGLEKVSPQGEYQQWFIIAAPGHPFLRTVILRVMQCIDDYNPWKAGIGLYGVLRTTGPIPYTLAIHDYIKRGLVSTNQYRFVQRIEDLGFRYSIYDKRNYLRSHRAVIVPYENLRLPVIRMGGCVKTKLIECIFVLEWKLRACLDAYRRLRKAWAK